MTLTPWWRRGEVLASPLAFDTETRMRRDDLDVPDLALIVASDGKRHVAVHPDDAGAFLDAHRGHRWYGYNVSFDFWVLDKATRSRVLWDAADAGRLTCLRMLWRLIKLATIGEPERRGTLADACVEYGVGPVPDKSDPYRLRYGELIGLPPASIDAHPEAEGFLAYALNDAIATHGLIRPMETEAVAHMKAHGGGGRIRPDALAKWGPLSVAIQTRADIVLDALSREPLRLDVAEVGRLTDAAKSRLEALQGELEAGCPGMWERYKRPPQALKLNPASGLARSKQKAIAARLVATAEAAGARVLHTANGEVSMSAKDWLRHLPDAPWVKMWAEYEGLKKRLSVMLTPMAGGTIYANYESLLKTGRTSASRHRSLPGVPVQQVPRDNSVRRLFLADEGHVRVTIDYSYLELRTLAACCLWRFGASKLAEACKAHTEAARAGRSGVPDPHEVMGAAILGVTPEEFMRLPPAQRKGARQSAKAVNFGYPGGLGVKKFCEYAKVSYKLDVTLAEAKALRETWLTAYPEMRKWLEDSTLANVAYNLRVRPSAVASAFGPRLWALRSAVEGWEPEEKARPYVEKLFALSKSPEVTALLATFDYSSASHEALARAVLRGVSCTPTGRVRAKVGHNEGANNPFQGLASDGGKEALWRLLYAGYRVKAFIHDEVLIDVPEGRCALVRPRIHAILDRAMEDVMGKGVPCMSESHIGPTWVKG